MRKIIRIKNKKRFSLSISFVLTIILLCILSTAFSNNINDFKNIKFIEVTVQEGQTLWELSENYVDNSIDIRKYIDVIEKINNIEGGYIYPGQSIKFIKSEDFKNIY
ncbi:LysM peptidoglycan-binding domain-containing protein [Caldicellulosiruptoraceae bacterium PP1]